MQLALRRAARGQFTIEIGEQFKFRSDEALAGRCEERRQQGFVDDSAGPQLAVDHVQTPVEHRFSGNVRPLGSLTATRPR